MKTLLGQLIASPLGVFLVLTVAATLEVSGDACFQSGLYQAAGPARAVWFVAGVALLAVYGIFVNLPQWDFGKLLGIYVVLFFLIAQVVAKLRFGQSPSVPVLAGGTLIVLGGLVMTFWKP